MAKEACDAVVDVARFGLLLVVIVVFWLCGCGCRHCVVDEGDVYGVVWPDDASLEVGDYATYREGGVMVTIVRKGS